MSDARTALVTGGAGFIGSTLAERLCADGWSVRCVDCLSPYYDVELKGRNAATAEAAGAQFEFVDLTAADLDGLLRGVDTVFHLAGQPGVRASWSSGFAQYSHDNILATQILLEAATHHGIERFVYASSSSVYGDNPEFPFTEASLPAPRSPYGVTKLAGEHLVGLYAANFGLKTCSLRYFTVYGPRQRPDMAIHRLIECALTGTPFRLNGDGSQERDFTFVADIVEANVLAATGDVPAGTVLNLGGGSIVSMLDLIDLVSAAAGSPIRVERQPVQAGDVRRTGADTTRAQAVLGWIPRTSLGQGVAAQVEWHQARRGIASTASPPASATER